MLLAAVLLNVTKKEEMGVFSTKNCF